MVKTRPPQHYYFATARMIQDKYFSAGKRVRMPNELDRDVREGGDPIYNAVIDCINRALQTHARIHVPREACRLFFDVHGNETR